MKRRRRSKGWGDGEEFTVDPKEKIDFDEGLPSTASEKRRARSTPDELETPLGEGKYSGTDLDFDDGFPVIKARVNISKAVAEIVEATAEEEAAPTRVHTREGVETRVSKVAPVPPQPAPVLKEVPPPKAPAPRIIRKGGPKKAQVKPTIRPTVKKAETTGFPSVLTWEAVRAGAMPEAGRSGLPPSLEQDVPPAFRFWKCVDQSEALAVRDALVEERIFTSETVRLVNGEMRRAVVETVEKLFLSPAYDPSEPVEVPADVRPVEKVAALLEPPESDRETVLFDEDITDVLGIETILENVAELAADFVIAARDSEQVRKAIGGPAFRLKSRDDLVFATNAVLTDSDFVEWVQLERSDELLKFAFSDGRKIPLLKAKEERIVYGIVLEPDEVDSQKDTVSKEEIEQACYKFMEDFGGLGRQHKELVNGKLVLLENFIAPVDFEVDGQMVKAGSWLMKERVVDSELWEAVKKGEYTGYSIGGSAVRQPVK